MKDELICEELDRVVVLNIHIIHCEIINKDMS